MDPPTELSVYASCEKLALQKINWLPGEENEGFEKWIRGTLRRNEGQVKIKII